MSTECSLKFIQDFHIIFLSVSYVYYLCSAPTMHLEPVHDVHFFHLIDVFFLILNINYLVFFPAYSLLFQRVLCLLNFRLNQLYRPILKTDFRMTNGWTSNGFTCFVATNSNRWSFCLTIVIYHRINIGMFFIIWMRKKSLIGRELVYSMWYGCKHSSDIILSIILHIKYTIILIWYSNHNTSSYLFWSQNIVSGFIYYNSLIDDSNSESNKKKYWKYSKRCSKYIISG